MINQLKRFKFIFILFLNSAFSTSFSWAQKSERLISFVNPFIGTGGHGHTFPGATTPFGMVQLSPDNGTQGWDWCSGYHYSDSVIAGFSHTHLSGTGIGDLADISVQPGIGNKTDTAAIKYLFSHEDEKASPGYYKVLLKEPGIMAELTASSHTGLHQYTFPEAKSAFLRFDLGFKINWDRPTDTYIKMLDDRTIVGYRMSTGWAKDQRVYFAAKLSKPVSDFKIMNEGTNIAGKEIKAKDVMAYLFFSTKKDEKILMRVGLSSASIEGALKSLETSPGFDFNATRAAAENLWEKELSKIKFEATDKDKKEIFYTGLYHTMMAPNIFGDGNNQFKSPNGKNLTSTNYTRYTVFSLWDTFRAANPLYTLIQQKRTSDFVRTLVEYQLESGQLPIWELHGNETYTMTGYHAVPVVADAILKDFKGFNYEKAYTAIKASAMQNIRGTDNYRKYGYLPIEKGGWSVTVTLEYAFDDWCIAQVAKKLGKTDDYKEFTKRAGFYANLFDKQTGFMRGKYENGKWITPFDPYYSEHSDKGQYIEGTAWQHSWFVPHDVQGMINLFGSKEAFSNKLDSLFTVSSKMTGENASPDASGFIGQYAHGNEPSHHIAYLNNYSGEAWKTQQRVRNITDSMYRAQPDGLAGNEDCGQMSAWYVFSAMGFYPVNPSSGIYVIGSPVADRVELNFENGKKFIVTAKNNSKTNIYIKEAKLNGKPLKETFITHKDLLAGGELSFEMSDKPNKKWGTNNVPPSMSAKK